MNGELEVVAHLSADFDPKQIHAVVHALAAAYGGPLALLVDPGHCGFDVVRDQS